MADDLSKLIRDRAAKGNLTHLSLIASPSRGAVVYKASFRGAVGETIFGTSDTDPVAALVEALKGRG